jgi:hypothetical protein
MNPKPLQIADRRSQICRPRLCLYNLQFLVALLAAGSLCAVVCATPPPQPRLIEKKGSASAWFVARAGNPVPLSLADDTLVRLRVEAPAPLEVEALDKPKSTPQWTLEAKGPPRKGGALWEQEYRLGPIQPGEYAVELPPLRYRSGGGEWQTVSWKPVPVRVRTSIKKAEPASARDITAIEDVPGVEPGHGWLLWAGLALGVLLLGVTAFVVQRRRVAKPPPLPPHEWALRELDRLAARPPGTGEEVEAYHTALSGVLRHYLERRFRIPAERQTTAEFLEAVGKSSELSAEQLAALGGLLTQCDLAKFARVWPSAEECQALVTRARGFVEETAPKVQSAQA